MWRAALPLVNDLLEHVDHIEVLAVDVADDHDWLLHFQ